MALILATVGVPAVGAGLAALTRGRVQLAVGLGATAATGGAAALLGWQLWRTAEPLTVRTPAPAGAEFVLVADGLAVSMVLMTAAVGVFAGAFAATQRGDARAGHPGYWPLWLVLWAGLHTLFLAGDLFTVYLMLELIGIAGAALVILGGGARTLVAGARYFYAELVASVTFLLGIALVWDAAGTVVLAALPAELAAAPAGRWGLAVMTAGLLLKVPLVPLAFWLPAAHTLAPSTVSPILSAVVVKTAFAVLVRLWFDALPGAAPPSAAQLLGVLGAAAVLWGSLNALRAQQLKLLIAHSTVAQLGLLFLLPPLVMAGAADAWTGGILHAIAHALPKAAMLMVAVLLTRTAGGETVAELAGSATRRPVAVFAFGIAAVSLVGLPPTGGFVAKWYLLVASVETGQWWWVPVIVVGSLLTAAYLMRVVKRAFAPVPAGLPATAVRGWADVVALLLAATALVLGLRPLELLTLLELGPPLRGLVGG